MCESARRRRLLTHRPQAAGVDTDEEEDAVCGDEGAGRREMLAHYALATNADERALLRGEARTARAEAEAEALRSAARAVAEDEAMQQEEAQQAQQTERWIAADAERARREAERRHARAAKDMAVSAPQRPSRPVHPCSRSGHRLARQRRHRWPRTRRMQGRR